MKILHNISADAFVAEDDSCSVCYARKPRLLALDSSRGEYEHVYMCKSCIEEAFEAAEKNV